MFKKNINFTTIKNHLVFYGTPINLGYAWGFGSLAGVCLGLQIITGLVLAMHYTPHITFAFASVEHIMRDVNSGWLLRYMHANGASAFFIVLYLHMGRTLYYGSFVYPRAHVWYSGIVIFLLTMATAFLGYVLPWGQMSFWGATVITNFFSVIPFIGTEVVQWLWGGFSVSNATLNRFFVLHFVLPFVIAGLVIVHIALLHNVGSNNPLGIYASNEKIPFYPYFYVKDLFGFMVFITLFLFIVFFYPNVLGHPDNYIPANPSSTPLHIVPEWYFLPFYAILRSIPNKTVGVIAMFASICILFILPFMYNLKRNYISFNNVNFAFAPFYEKMLYWGFIVCFFLLMWIGACPPQYPYIIIGQLCGLYYFFFLFFFIFIL